MTSIDDTNPQARCCVSGCVKTHLLARGMCNAHYLRWYRHGSPTAGGTPTGTVLPWLAEQTRKETDDCILFPFASDAGYGVVRFEGRTMYASRAVAIMCYGEQPGMEAAHSCKNKLCCNKRHIRWDTHAGNMADMIEHGTSTRGRRIPSLQGVKNVSARFTEAEVRTIRSLHGTCSSRELGAYYGVTHAAILAIWNRKTWAHL